MQNEFGNILHIDLTTREVRSTREKEEVLKQYLGGSGYGAYLLCQDLDNLLDPFDPRSPLLFLTGPLAGVAVLTSGRHTISWPFSADSNLGRALYRWILGPRTQESWL